MRREKLCNDDLKKIKKARILTTDNGRYIISERSAIIPESESEIRGKIEIISCKIGNRLKIKVNGRFIKSEKQIERIFLQK